VTDTPIDYTRTLVLFKNPDVPGIGIVWCCSNTFEICALDDDELTAASTLEAFTSYGSAADEIPTLDEAQAIAHRHFVELLVGDSEESAQ
jgi:hypothetical protein